MNSDSRIITQHGHFDVLSEQHTVHWPDASTLTLHRVQIHGTVHRFLRALRHSGVYWAVVDLRKLCSTIEADLCILPPSDADGAVLFNLRADYRNAATFTLAAAGQAEALWAAYTTHPVATTPMVPA